MGKNIKILPLKVFVDNEERIIKEVEDIPPFSLSFLVNSMIYVGDLLKKNKFTQDLSYEMHIWYLLYISFVYSKNPSAFIIEHLNEINKRFISIKRYFNNRPDEIKRLIPKSTKSFIYFTMTKSDKIIKKTLIGEDLVKVKHMNNKHLLKVKSIIDAQKQTEVSKGLEIFFDAFKIELKISESLSNLGNPINGIPESNSELWMLARHRYHYSLQYFAEVFIKGEFL